MGIENLIQKGVPLMLDKERHLYYNFAAFKILAQKYGAAMNAFEQLEKLVNDLTRQVDSDDEASAQSEMIRLTPEFLELMVDLVYAGIVAEDPAATEESVAQIIDLDNMVLVITAVKRAAAMHLPQPKGEEGDPQKA